MKQANHSSAKWVLAVAALVVLVSGSIVLGSNMGFKFNMPLPAFTDPAPQGDNWMSLPYLTPYANKYCLCDELGLSASAVVQQFDASIGALDAFFFCGGGTCAGGGPAIVTEKAIRITDSGSPLSAIVVGAHDPSRVVRLECRDVGAGELLPVGDNWVSLPYHATAANRQALCDEIGGVTRISEWDGTFGTFINPYFCGISPGDSPFTKGLAVKIELDVNSAACTGPGFVNWVPNHF